MPRRNHRPRPRARVAPLLPAERPCSPQQLAQRLVSRGLADAVILGPERPEPDERRTEALTDQGLFGTKNQPRIIEGDQLS